MELLSRDGNSSLFFSSLLLQVRLPWDLSNKLQEPLVRVEVLITIFSKSWSTIVELISVWKRLREFEDKLNEKIRFDKSIMPIDKKYIDLFHNVSAKAAIACFDFIGKKDKIAADKAAVDSMRHNLNKIEMKGKIVIGEGELDNAPMLYTGEKLGSNNGPEFDICRSFRRN